MKRRNELNMKPAAVIHMLSPRNFKIGSYTRSPHVGGLATVSRHPAVVHAGGGLAYIYMYTHANLLYEEIYACACSEFAQASTPNCERPCGTAWQWHSARARFNYANLCTGPNSF